MRCKIVINNKQMEQVNEFIYLGNDVAFNYNKIIENKISKFQMITELLIRK